MHLRTYASEDVLGACVMPSIGEAKRFLTSRAFDPSNTRITQRDPMLMAVIVEAFSQLHVSGP